MYVALECGNLNGNWVHFGDVFSQGQHTDSGWEKKVYAKINK